MQIINGKKYYSIKEIINELNEKFGFNFKKDNSTFQRFYRRKYPFVWGKSEEADFQYKLYSEDVMIELINFYDRKEKIREYLTKVKELRAENTLFIKKYKKINKDMRGS